MNNHQIPESAAEVAAQIPRHAWSLMDEDQRDALMRDIVLPRYMGETTDGVKLGPKWWGQAVGASSGAIQKRVERLRQSQKPANEATTRALPSAGRHAKAVMRNPEQRRQTLAELDDAELDEIAEDAQETILARMRATKKGQSNGEKLSLEDIRREGFDPQSQWADNFVITLYQTAGKLTTRVRKEGLILRTLDPEKALRYLSKAEKQIADVRAAIQEIVNDSKAA